MPRVSELPAATGPINLLYGVQDGISVRINGGPEFIDVRWFGATGDGFTDDTLAIQAAIDAAITSGHSVLFSPGTYIVSKNTALTGFNSDQPCLLVRAATDMVISGQGATLKVNTHAQGILEIQTSTRVVVDGLTFEGRGNFPNLDGTTGRGEKGTATDGYNTTGFWTYYKNNSFVTSARTDGGFGGVFPQDGGGTAATWGTWGGGYIGNMGIGLLVHNNAHDIIVRNCKATAFNCSGFGIGHNGDFFPVNLAYPDCTNIAFIDCIATDNYNAGMSILAVDGFQIRGCDVSSNGHPSAVPLTNTYADPGYGWTAQSTIYSASRNGRVSSCIANNNVRKGLDIHAGRDITVTENIVKGNAVGGIFSDWGATTHSSLETSGIVISHNILSGNAFAPINLYQAYIGGPGASNTPCDTVVSSNIFEDSYTGGIRVRYASNVEVANNIFRGSASGGGASQAFIDCQPNNGTASTDSNVTVIGNQIYDSDNHINVGIRMLYDYQDAVVANNIVHMTGASANAGIAFVSCTNVHAFGNAVRLGAAGTPLSLAQTEGHVYGNYGTGGSVSSNLIPNTRGSVRPPDCAAFTVTFTGGTPTITNNSAPDIVTAIASTAFGFQVTLSGLGNYAAMDNSVRATWAMRSSGGINFGGGGIMPFLYTRGLSHSGFELGMKSTPVGSDLAASTATSGQIDVFIFLA